MEFDLNEDQIILQDSIRKFFEKEVSKDLIRESMINDKGYSPEIWKKMAELGWMGILFEEEYGGFGGAFLDLAIIFEEMGRAAFISPFFATIVLGSLLIQDHGSKKIKQSILPGISDGSIISTLAIFGKAGFYDKDELGLSAEAVDDGYVINGSAFFVPYAHIADHMICVTKTSSGITLFIVDTKADGLEIITLHTITGKAHDCVVNFKNVLISADKIVGEIDKGWEYMEALFPKINTLLSCQCIGGMQEVLRFTLDHLNQRVQFGKPLAALQVVQHYCSDMFIKSETSRYPAYRAAWLISDGLECKKDASIAKSWCSEAYKDVTKIAHQVTGAIGFTDEYDLHLFSKQAKTIELLFGNGAFHRAVVADEMGL